MVSSNPGVHRSSTESFKLELLCSSSDDTDKDLERQNHSTKIKDVNPEETSWKSRFLTKGKDTISMGSFLKGLFGVSVGEWILILSLIFGGCCSNIYAIEAIVSELPDSGILITFCQFLFVALEGYIHFFDSSNPKGLFIKKPKVPMKRWLIIVVLFFTVSIMNNLAFGMNISVPLHIIFRSGGAVMTTIVGFLWGKRYTRKQVFATLILTIGVTLATFASSSSSSSSSSSNSTTITSNENQNQNDSDKIIEEDAFKEMFKFYCGIATLSIAGILMSIMALFVEKTYAIYGKHWRENLFFQHFLSLPFFLFISKNIYLNFLNLWNSEPKISLSIIGFENLTIPIQFFNLLLVTITQYLCVRGVQNLAGNTGALTVMIILNVRKFVSLLLSIWIFGNPVNLGILIGAVFVFIGVFLYSR